MTTIRSVLLAVVALAMASCSTSPDAAADPLTDAQNPTLGQDRRAKAIDRAWDDAVAGRADRAAVRESLKTIAWASSNPPGVRAAALERLLEDSESIDDTRRMIRLMLPREKELRIVEYLSLVAAERSWTDMNGALVRSLSREAPRTPDRERPEYRALERLNPGRSVERVAYDVFLDPGEEDPGAAGIPTLDWVMRTRADAWDLLARLDADGELRAALVTGRVALDHPAPEADEALVALRAAVGELGVIPITGEELKWLAILHSDPAYREWWSASAAAVRGLSDDQRDGLRLRHIEALRWASSNRPEWASASRDSLRADLHGRLDGRATNTRVGSSDEPSTGVRERFSGHADDLSWGDLLTLLVIDEAVQFPEVRDQLARQNALDREDHTTEYGGVIEATPSGFRAVLYPPRPAQRQGDRSFVASADMIKAATGALAHYHFHAHQSRNAAYSGPSNGDLEYATRHGANCRVVTSLGSDRLGVDYYRPGRIVVDLGEIAP